MVPRTTREQKILEYVEVAATCLEERAGDNDLLRRLEGIRRELGMAHEDIVRAAAALTVPKDVRTP